MKVLKLAIIVVGGLLMLSLSCWAQEETQRHQQQIVIQGSGFFGSSRSSSGISNEPTQSGGFLAGYRFNLNKWLAAEADYDFVSNSQNYSSGLGNVAVKTYTHGVSGAGVVKLPRFYKLSTFVLAGGGALVFDPRDTKGIGQQTRGTFVYGAGGDYSLMKYVALRAQYRGFVYKVPDFGINQLKLNQYTHAAAPSAGLVFSF